MAVAVSWPRLYSSEIVVMLENKMEGSTIKWPKKG